jgi:hypothetical protein
MTRIWKPHVFTWRVTAEAAGMLTFPPGQVPLRIGDVEIRLKDPGQASSIPRPVVTSCRGVVPEDPAQLKSPVTLAIVAVVEAGTADEARSKGYTLIDEALDLAMLASGGQIAPAWVTNAVQDPFVGGQSQFTHAAVFVCGEVKVWTAKCDALLPRIQAKLETLSDADCQQIRLAFHWWRRACMQQETHSQFLFLWFALEALARMSFSSASRPANKIKVIHLLAHVTNIWSEQETGDRYGLRCDIAHGDINISFDTEMEIDQQIRPMQEAVQTIVQGIINGVLLKA